MDSGHMRVCQHCQVPYDWRRSPGGSLKMTCRGSLCAKAGPGLTIGTLLNESDVVRSEWKELLAP